MILICQYRFSLVNKWTTRAGGDVDMGESIYVGGREYMENLYTFFDLKTPLKL